MYAENPKNRYFGAIWLLETWFLLTNDHFSYLLFFSNLVSALLSQTLRTYTRTGCEHEPITLSCPRGTSISIDVAQYMPTTIENECVTVTSNIIQDGVVNAGTEIEIKAPEKCSSWQSELSVSTNPIIRFF